jgi:hypothetical protein
MVHVAVGQQHMTDGNQLVRRLADIKTHIQLRDANDCFLPGNRVTKDFKITDLNFR